MQNYWRGIEMDARADIPNADTKVPGWNADERRFKVFVSYSRRDAADIAVRLVAWLESLGLAPVIDTRDLEFGERWQQQLRDFIRQADAIVFIVTPGSVASKWCRWEIAQVAAQSKRLVPVLHLDVLPDQIPAELSEIQLFNLRSSLDYDSDQTFGSRCQLLAEGLQRDRDWLQEHTRLIELAHAWRTARRAPDRLLRGTALRDAEKWSADRPRTAPQVGQAHLEFISASQEAAKRRSRRWSVGLAALAAGALGLSGVALVQWREAILQQGIAEEKTEEAVANLNTALTNESRLMARLATGELAQGDSGTAMALAIEALPSPDAPTDRPLVPETASVLADAKDRLREQAVVHLDGFFYSPTLSPKGELVAVGSNMQDENDKSARIYSGTDGHLLRALDGFDFPVHFASFNNDGSLLMTLDGPHIRVWRVADWAPIAEARWQGANIFTAAFSDDFERIWIGAEDGAIATWKWKGSFPFQAVGKHAALIDTILVSPFSNYVAVLSQDGVLTLWNGRTLDRLSPTELRVADPDPSTSWLSADLTFSMNGDWLISVPTFYAFEPAPARIWNVAEGSLEREVAISKREGWEPGQVADLRFAGAAFIDEQAVISVARDNGSVRFTEMDEEIILSSSNPLTPILPSIFALDGAAFVGASDSVVHAWFKNPDSLLHEWSTTPVPMKGHTGAIERYVVRDYFLLPRGNEPGWSEVKRQDVRKLMTIGNDRTVRIWSTTPPAAAPDDAQPNRPDWTSASVAELTRTARIAAPRCLTPDQRRAFFLPEAPPRWCITGAGLEAEKDPGKWTGKWPYHTAEWRSWLAAREEGKDLPMPVSPPSQ